MRLLVTGGAGYIGSITAAELLYAGHEVVVFDNLSHGHRAAIPAGASLVVGDVTDRAALDALFRRQSFDAVLHFAALIEAGESVAQPAGYLRNNAEGSATLLETMMANGVARLVFSSSAAVYGNPAQSPVSESAPLRGANPYGESKIHTERLLENMAGLRYASLRYFNAAGATAHQGEDHRPESHLIPRVLAAAAGNSEVAIFGADYPTPDRTCVRDYVHVLDLASAHLLALDALARAPRLVYNLGNGAGFSVRQVIEAAQRVTGRAIRVREAPRRPGDPAVLVASSHKIRRELGWQPRFAALDEIVASAWHWRQEHPDGYGAA